MSIKTTTSVLGTVALAVVLGVGAGAVAGSAANSEGRTVEEFEAYVDETRVNENGQTYGSLASVSNDADAPDLILVELPDGSRGYVLRDELLAAEGAASSPEEAVAREEDRSRTPDPALTVYAADGETVLGTWQMGSTPPPEE